jgi:hypothetical protein
MRTSVLFTFLVSACCAIDTAADDLIHIGFDLKPTYGTSAVAYPNGTLVGVAYVEGSDDYKNAMRTLSLESSTHPAYVDCANIPHPDLITNDCVVHRTNILFTQSAIDLV